MLPRKKRYTWTVTLSLVFINIEYSSEFYWQCPILVKLQEKCRSSRPEEFCKKGALENFANHRCFPVNFVNLFSKNTSTGCFWKDKSRSSRPEVFCKKGALRNFAKLTRKHLCQSLFYSLRPACNFIKIESPWQVFSWTRLFYRTPPVAASVKAKVRLRHHGFLCELSKNFWMFFRCAARIFLKFTKILARCFLNISLQMDVS